MSRTLALKVPKPLNVLQLDRPLASTFVLGIHCLDTTQVQHGIQQHRSVTERENEAVSIWPDGIGGIEAQKLLPQTVNNRSHPHRRSWMPGVRRLHGIHGKSADRIDAQLIDLCAGKLNRYGVGRHRCSPMSLLSLSTPSFALL